jgi:hypothetical protein
MTQYVRAINIANNSIKSFVFDTNTSNTLNTAAVASAVAISANVSAQAVNTFVTLQTLQVANTPPSINTISITDSSYNILDDTAANTGGAYLTITGTNFQSGAIVMVGSSNTALSTTFVDPFTLRAEIPAISSGSYPVYVVNSNGGTAIKINGLTTSPFPIWGTGPTFANVISNTAFSGTLSANSDSSITYANTTILPTGFNLLANGYYYGNVFVGTETTYSFDVKATDVENQDATRTFSLTVKSYYPIEYLVVAGGGGGGGTGAAGYQGGGGGAGGLYVSTLNVVKGAGYTITVGSGGAGGAARPSPTQAGLRGANGANSIISGYSGYTSAVIIPGGGGGGGGGPGGNPAIDGGSGGGGGNAGSPPPAPGNPSGLATGSPGFGIAGTYGYPGGGPNNLGHLSGGGGAGGAGVGTPDVARAGGPGYTWPYTGNSYAGGGNAGNYPSPGSGGGGGGGGTAGNPPRTGGDGTINSGGGGGGGGWPAPGSPYAAAGGQGGSGVVILAVPTPNYPGSVPGATVTTPPAAPGKTILTFNSPGTFTA